MKCIAVALNLTGALSLQTINRLGRFFSDTITVCHRLWFISWQNALTKKKKEKIYQQRGDELFLFLFYYLLTNFPLVP